MSDIRRSSCLYQGGTFNTPDTPSAEDGPAAEPGSPAYEAERANTFRKLAEVLGEVDAGSLTAEQLQTIVLEMDLEFGVSVQAEEDSADQPRNAEAELQIALDRLAVDALTAARDAERRICKQIAALPDADDELDHDHKGD